MKLHIRKATLNDLDKISELENICFPESEAATKEIFKGRLNKYANHFLLAESDNNEIICVVNGLVTDLENLVDEMYAVPDYHNENGKWQMIFGVETHPRYQKTGIATKVLSCFIDNAKKEGRAGIVLTCKKELVPFYKKFGFDDEGVSKSEHGDAIWYQMRLRGW